MIEDRVRAALGGGLEPPTPSEQIVSAVLGSAQARRRHRLIAGSGVVAVTMIGATVAAFALQTTAPSPRAGLASGATPSSTPPPFSCISTGELNGTLLPRVEAITQRAAVEPSYAGSYTDTCTNQVHVQLTTAERAVRARILATEDPNFVVFSVVSNSLATLSSLAESIHADTAALATNCCSVTTSFVSEQANRVVVRVRGLTEDSRQYLLSRYGSGLITVEEATDHDTLHLTPLIKPTHH